MVESHPYAQSDWFPGVAGPLRKLGNKVAEFFSPVSDAAAVEDSYVIEVELPGVKEDDVTIEQHDSVLTIEGNKRSSREASGRAYYFSERTYGAFRRVFRLPADVDKDGIVASMEDGVLTIVLPKKEASNDATRKIVIRNTGTANL